MKIIAQTQNQNKTSLRLIPFWEDGSLQTHLFRLAKEIKHSADWLLRDFKAEYGQVLSCYHADDKIVLLGLGTKKDRLSLSNAFNNWSRSLENVEMTAMCLELNRGQFPDEHVREIITLAVEGLYLGGYQPGQYKSSSRPEHLLWKPDSKLFILQDAHEPGVAGEAAEKGYLFADTFCRILDLVNAPSNHKTPDVFINWLHHSSRQFGYSAQVLNRSDLEEQGFHALLAVNRASVYDPAVLILEYKGKGKGYPIGLAGKGVTFDTGGVSIKPSNQMHQMKSDMGGAAVVMGTIEMAARLKLPVDIVGVVPVTDNSIGSNALKPSDVISSYSGKTIEVIDTDAEGRLILADALSFLIRQYQPRQVIDLATLTGSAVSTFGYKGAAFFSNHESLVTGFYNASNRTGERIWQLPLWEEYEEDLKSDIADLRNFSGRPLAGAIGAAKFLEAFTDNHPRWAHFDIAGVAFKEANYAKMKAASGFGIRLLLDYLSNQ